MESGHTSDQIDLMRNLPEELLLDIMGMMKTRAAVQTCMLSKPWNHLWPFLSGLDFDLKDFNSGDPEQDKQRFSHFVTTMLERHKAANLHKFRLSCADLSEKQDCSSIQKWIMYAIQHQVRLLELAVCRRVLTQNIFVSDSIEEFHLHLSKCSGSVKNINEIQAINLPRLRKMQLHGHCQIGSNLFTKLFLGSPFLEELWLESFDVPFRSTIYSQTLQRLTFKNCSDIYKLTIRAANLVSLCFIGSVNDFMRVCYQCRSTRSLTHATVSVLTDTYSFFSLNDILDYLSHVENLELCVSKSTPNSHSLSYNRTIYNLKMLSFCGHSLDYFPCIWKYLPNLEKLTLWPSCQHSHQHYQESLQWDDALRGALVECKKLKVVEIVSAAFDDRKMQMVDDLRQLGDVEIVISNRGF